MNDRIEKLLSISTDSLGPEPPRFRTNLLQSAGRLGRELADFLRRRNGFYAFESALHVFPACRAQEGIMDLETWNDPDFWICHYEDMAVGMVFFAEGIYADQFAIKGNEIVRFEVETGLTEPVAASMEEWADLILTDYERQTDWFLAHDWQVVNGALPCGQRLVSIIPLIMEQGEYQVHNFYALDALEAMRYRGNFAVQIRDLPDGTEIEIKVV